MCSGELHSLVGRHPLHKGSPAGSVRNLPAKAGDVSSISGSGRSPGGGNDNSLQYSCLEKLHGQRSLVG